jgi:hypothetical protein
MDIIPAQSFPPGYRWCATLLYERYKQLHNDSLPDAALIKNVICNAADDLGNIGPTISMDSDGSMAIAQH